MNQSNIVQILVFGTLLVFVLILALIGAITIATRKDARQQVALAEARLSYQSELRTIEMEVQETTLTNIAAELHDNIGQLLTVLKLQLEKAKIQTPTSEAMLLPMSKTLDDVLQQVRLLSHSLSNELVSDGKLTQLIGQEVQRLQHLGRGLVHFESDQCEPEVARDTRTILFRIFQEILSNAMRHSDANNVWISLNGNKCCQLIIRDDGKGFDRDAVLASSNGLGLKNILRRASVSGITCRFDAIPGNGCTFSIEVPSTSLTLNH